LFTQCLLDTIEGKGKKKVTARELADSIRAKLPVLLNKLGVDEDDQTPVFFPPRPPAWAVLVGQ